MTVVLLDNELYDDYMIHDTYKVITKIIIKDPKTMACDLTFACDSHERKNRIISCHHSSYNSQTCHGPGSIPWTMDHGTLLVLMLPLMTHESCKSLQQR